MQKTLRLLAVILFLIATFAVASTPVRNNTVTLAEGSSPMPDCMTPHCK